ncbi:MAG TPA: Ig-like domain-containing protein, partial [Thermoanaerobaculia bacterium]
MRTLSGRLLLSLCVLFLPTAVFAHSITVSGTNSFTALDGSLDDHDGLANGVFTVSDGSLIVNGTINCNDDSGRDSACSMAFNVSGDIVINAGGAIYAENRSGSGTGGAITFTAGRDLVLNGPTATLAGAIVSTSSRSSSGSTGGAINANVSRNVTLAAGSTIDAGSANARGGNVTVTASGVISANGNVYSGPSRTLLATRLGDGAALDGGSSNSIGGAIKLTSSTFVEPALVVGSNANIVSQGDQNGAGPVTLEGCGIQIQGLVAALSRKDSAAKVVIRSGKDVLIDARDLGVANATLGRNARLRADAPSGTAINKGIDIFAAETIDILGPVNSTLFPLTSLAGLHDAKSYGGLIHIISTGEGVNASGNVVDDGRSQSGDTGGSIEIYAKANINLHTAVIRSFGDSSTGNPSRGGGSVTIRSYSGNVVWTSGFGDVRPTGSSSSLPASEQGRIDIKACGTINLSGSSFPTNGSAVGPWPVTATSVCASAAPALPAGTPSLVVCNTPPVANDAAASTNEDNSVTVTLTGADADGDPLTFTIVTGPSNGTLGAVTVVNATTSTVVYTPNSNYNGTDSFTFQANDGNGGTDTGVATITIAAVNDAPGFLAGPTVSALEDSGAQSYANWASNISAGPADESAQTVSFSVTNDNNALFSVQPSVASNGTLTWTPAANAYGTATITVTATDNGGTANGGVNTSASQSVVLTVTPVNDAPSFTAGANQNVGEDAGAQTVANWATGINAGPNESSQNVTFSTTSSNNALFS